MSLLEIHDEVTTDVAALDPDKIKVGEVPMKKRDVPVKDGVRRDALMAAVLDAGAYEFGTK